MKIKTHKCKSWSDFKSRIMEDLYHDKLFLKGEFLFRGQGDESWALSSSFDRWFNGEKKEKVRISNELLNEFIKECELEDIPLETRNNDLMMLSLGQHHGLPTRLLDWSESPYVAAFFAFSGHIRHGINLEKHVAIWVLDSNNYIWDKDYGCEIVQVPSFGNERIKNQHGKFTYLKTPDSSIEEYVIRCDEPKALVKYLIPVRDAYIAMADLDVMGLNHARIYPGISGNAKASEVRVLFNQLEKTTR